MGNWGLILILIFFIFLLVILLFRKNNELRKLKFKNKSLATRHGQIYEQYFPFLKKYPYDPKNFRFLGTPVDGVQFEKDKIIFIEFKTGNSKLKSNQKEIKRMIERKKLYFEEHRL